MSNEDLSKPANQPDSPIKNENPPVEAPDGIVCYLNGQEYPNFSEVCLSNKRIYTCVGGSWYDTGKTC